MKQILFTFLFGVFLLPLAHAQSAPEKKKTFCNLYDNRPAISDGALAGCPKSVVDLARLANGWLSEATSKGGKGSRLPALSATLRRDCVRASAGAANL
jgi:hypothetical protein